MVKTGTTIFASNLFHLKLLTQFNLVGIYLSFENQIVNFVYLFKALNLTAYRYI